jgi:hypothetical protein
VAVNSGARRSVSPQLDGQIDRKRGHCAVYGMQKSGDPLSAPPAISHRPLDTCNGGDVAYLGLTGKGGGMAEDQGGVDCFAGYTATNRAWPNGSPGSWVRPAIPPCCMPRASNPATSFVIHTLDALEAAESTLTVSRPPIWPQRTAPVSGPARVHTMPTARAGCSCGWRILPVPDLLTTSVYLDLADASRQQASAPILQEAWEPAKFIIRPMSLKESMATEPVPQETQGGSP